ALGKSVDSKTQRNEIGLSQLFEEGSVLFLVDAQLTCELHLAMETTAYDLIANLHDTLGHAAKIALVEHVQMTAPPNQPLQFIHKVFLGADAPVEPFGTERTARPATTPACDDRGQLIIVEVSVYA